MSKELYKRYVEIVSLIDKEGRQTPLFLCWDDHTGRKKFKIDRVLSIRESHSVVGGCGIQYRCQIQGMERNLYLEKGIKWFIESEKP